MKLKTQIYLNNLHAVMWIRMNYFTNPDPEFFSIRIQIRIRKSSLRIQGKKIQSEFFPKNSTFQT